MLLVRIVKNKINDYLDQVRSSKGEVCHVGLGKGLDYSYYNTRSSIKLGSAPDTKKIRRNTSNISEAV